MGVDTVVERTGIAGVVSLERTAHVDRRGSLDRLVDVDFLAEELGGFTVAQVNLSVTRGRGTVRGMHYQSGPEAETKVVTCLAGRAFDVAVDLRAGSATFLQWHGVVPEGGVGRSFVIPAGCAHGFQVLSEECTLLYDHSASYQPELEGGVHPGDPRVAVSWPEAVVGLSDRDASLPNMLGDWEGLVQ